MAVDLFTFVNTPPCRANFRSKKDISEFHTQNMASKDTIGYIMLNNVAYNKKNG